MGLYRNLGFRCIVFVLDVDPVPHCLIVLLLCFAATIALQNNLHSGMPILQHWLLFGIAWYLLCFHGSFQFSKFFSVKDNIVISMGLHWIYLFFTKLVIFKILILTHWKSLCYLLFSPSVITFNFFIIFVFSFFGKRFISRYLM